ncbi:ATP-binding protein [Acidiphilium sp. PA]|uniref:ATP-binding protein n=2 Tax=unclassified Acidiphilium TaxID=2617493 RepID=UPI002ADE6E20|nr:ATP-binding protein [Acidiphilium sp. PA]
MLNHPTLDQIHQLGLAGMARAFTELDTNPETPGLSHGEWLGLLLDREITARRDKRLTTRLRYARLRHNATIEDVDYRSVRGLDRALFQKLIQGDWIDAHDNLVLSGPTGVGKSWLACALGHKACRDDRPALYQRAPKLFTELAVARAEGRHGRMIRTLGAVNLLILDDMQPTAETVQRPSRHSDPKSSRPDPSAHSAFLSMPYQPNLRSSRQAASLSHELRQNLFKGN